MRFIGNIEAKVDSKGRIFLPAQFRRILQGSGEEKLMLRKDVYQNCLVLYPESCWNEQLSRLRSRLNRWDARQQTIFRQFVAEAQELAIDGNGRVLVPKRSLQQARIEQQVCFIGMDDTIELWAKELADAPFMEAGEFGSAMQELLGDTPHQETKNDEPTTRP